MNKSELNKKTTVIKSKRNIINEGKLAEFFNLTSAIKEYKETLKKLENEITNELNNGAIDSKNLKTRGRTFSCLPIYRTLSTLH